MTSRRHFLHGLCATAVGSRLAAAADRKVGYAIVGLGRISMNQFLPGLQISERSRPVAVVSGSPEKAAKIAEKYGIAPKNIYNYQNYDRIADNPEIEAVYIALPNSMHPEYTIRAARAGKHVLCEKPMSNTPGEAEQMIAACKKADRKLMIAYRCQYEPTNLRAIKLVREGAIGELRGIDSQFGFVIRPNEWRLKKSMAGGGPLMDIGIYSLQACRYITGEEPVEIHANSSVVSKDGRFTEVEENLAWGMRFPSGVLASCICSYGAPLGNRYRVVGTKGFIQLEPAFSYDGLKIRVQIQGQPPLEEATDDPSPRQFARQADHFSTCIVENREPRSNGLDGLRDQKILAAIYQAAADRRTIKL